MLSVHSTRVDWLKSWKSNNELEHDGSNNEKTKTNKNSFLSALVRFLMLFAFWLLAYYFNFGMCVFLFLFIKGPFLLRNVKLA